MITGRKHEWCGRINWEGKDECTCRPHGNAKEIYQFTDVVLDNPVIEELGKKAATLAKKLGMKVTIGYDTDHENESGEVVGVLILDGWVMIYPEKLPFETIGDIVYHDGFVIDVVVPEHNYPNEPDGIDYVRVHTSTYVWNVLAKALELIWKNHLDNIIEGINTRNRHADMI